MTITYVLPAPMAWIMYGTSGNKMVELTIGKVHAYCVTTRFGIDFTFLRHVSVMASQITILAIRLSTQQLVQTVNKENSNKTTLIMPHWEIFNSNFIETFMLFSQRWLYSVVTRRMQNKKCTETPFKIKSLKISSVYTFLHNCLIALTFCTEQGTLQWRHNDRDEVPNDQPHDCLLNQSSASLALRGEFTGDRWIPRTNGQ